jgi:hypothetical protein
MMPLGDEEQQYIADLDADSDIQLLQRELPALRHECLRVLEVSTALLKRGVQAGLSLMEVASVMTRPLVGLADEPSELERLCLDARAVVGLMSPAHEQPAAAGLGSSHGSVLKYLAEEEEEEGDVLLEGSQEGLDEEAPGPGLRQVMGWDSDGAAGASGAAFCLAQAQAPPAGGPCLPVAAACRQRSLVEEMLFDIEEAAAQGRGGGAAGAGLKPRPRPLVTISASAEGGPMSPGSLASICSGCSSGEQLGSLGCMLSPAPLLTAPCIPASAPASRRTVALTASALLWQPARAGAGASAGDLLSSPAASTPGPGTPSAPDGAPAVHRADSSSSAELSSCCGCSPTATQAKLQHAAPEPAQAQAPAQAQPLARAISLQAEPWSSIKGPPKPALAGKRCSKSPSKKALACMYPPPVLSQSVSELITGIFSTYDGVAWRAFMQVLVAMMDDVLRSGRWRQAPTSRVAAQSCPRF